ncbi:hypothetical protein HK097_006526, partial [Rhizophlyctis rosea]
MSDLREQIAKKIAGRMASLDEPASFVKALTRAIASDFELYRVDDVENERQVVRSNDRRLSYIANHDIRTLPPLTDTFAVTEVSMKDRSPVLAWFPHCRAHYKDRPEKGANNASRIDILIHLPNPIAAYMEGAKVQEASTRLSRSNSKTSLQRSFIDDEIDDDVPSFTDSPLLTPLPTPPPSMTTDAMLIRKSGSTTDLSRSTTIPSRAYSGSTDALLKRIDSKESITSSAGPRGRSNSVRTTGSAKHGLSQSPHDGPSPLISANSAFHEVPGPVDGISGAVPLKATMGFKPTSEKHLDVAPGDLLHIYSTEEGGWCYGVNLTSGGGVGVFPAVCVGGQAGGVANEWGVGSSHGSEMVNLRRKNSKREGMHFSMHSEGSQREAQPSWGSRTIDRNGYPERSVSVPGSEGYKHPGYQPAATAPSRPMTPASSTMGHSRKGSASSTLSSRIKNVFSKRSRSNSQSSMYSAPSDHPEPEIIHIPLPPMNLPSPTPAPVPTPQLTSASVTSFGLPQSYTRPRASSSTSKLSSLADPDIDIGTRPETPRELTIAAGEWSTELGSRKSGGSFANSSSFYLPTEMGSEWQRREYSTQGGYASSTVTDERTAVASHAGAPMQQRDRRSCSTVKSQKDYVGPYGPDIRIESVEVVKGG